MQPTKYASQAPQVRPEHAYMLPDASGYSDIAEADCSTSEGVWSASDTRASGCRGCEAPLDLIEEHITEENSQTQYRRDIHGGGLLKNWYVPEDWTGADEVNLNYVVKIQPFAKGGYEATVRQIDLVKIGNAITNTDRKGTREAPDEISVENQMKAASRAKRQMRYKVRNMQADHLHTLTRRESDPATFWNPDQWAAAWDKYRRLMTRVIGEFPYVAILEKHKKGNYHLHVAWCGRVNVNLARKMWLSAIGGGKGSGNIDAKKIKVQSGGDRASRIARYISKYVGKHFEDAPRYNKKRYWASRQTLEEARRYILNADTLDGAINEAFAFLGLDLEKFQTVFKGQIRNHNLFVFPDGGGMWINYIPELHGVDGTPF